MLSSRIDLISGFNCGRYTLPTLQEVVPRFIKFRPRLSGVRVVDDVDGKPFCLPLQ